MTAKAIRERFLAAIRDRGEADRYIDANEEREIIQIALQLGSTADNARAELAEVCRQKGYVVESVVVRRVKAILMNHTGRIDRRSFDQWVNEAHALTGETRSLPELQKLVIGVMEDTGRTRVKRGLFRNWYGELKQELGLS